MLRVGAKEKSCSQRDKTSAETANQTTSTEIATGVKRAPKGANIFYHQKESLERRNGREARNT